MPPNLHELCKWSDKEPLQLTDIQPLHELAAKMYGEHENTNLPYKPKSMPNNRAVKTNKNSAVSAEVHAEVVYEKKRKIECTEDIPVTKKRRLGSTHRLPKALTWDGTDYSCAYDAMYSILYNVWREKKAMFNSSIRGLNEYTKTLAMGFQSMDQNRNTFEEVQVQATQCKSDSLPLQDVWHQHYIINPIYVRTYWS